MSRKGKKIIGVDYTRLTIGQANVRGIRGNRMMIEGYKQRERLNFMIINKLNIIEFS